MGRSCALRPRSSTFFGLGGMVMSYRMLFYTCVLVIGLIAVLRTDFRTRPDEMRTQREREPQLTPQNTAAAYPLPALTLPPPQKSEVRAAVKRIYRHALVLDEAQSPAFVVGDFNGDQSQDLIVAVRPHERHLAELNNPLANWIVHDLRETSNPLALRKRPPQIQTTDVLLAVIHGYGPQGWRNPESQQTYLMRNALGKDMHPYPWEKLLPRVHRRQFTGMTGDAVMQILNGEDGFLYWNGARYLWFAQNHQALARRPLER